MIKGMSKIILIVGLLMVAAVAEAHQPAFPDPESADDYIELSDIATSQAFYGALDGHPHTYQIIVSDEPATLFAEVLVPDIEGAQNNRSGIIVKEEIRGVSEVARLRAREASWETFYEPFGADSYRRGSAFEGELEPGVYLLEVSTPDNDGKYVLVVGKEERFSLLEYSQTLAQIYRVKRFFEKSPVRVFESPLVYGPTLVVLLIIGLLYYRRHYA